MNREQERLLKTIKEDCEELQKDYNKESLRSMYIYLQEGQDSKESGLYTLVLNGYVLWWGTLQEINAIVKSFMLIHFEKEKFE